MSSSQSLFLSIKQIKSHISILANLMYPKLRSPPYRAVAKYQQLLNASASHGCFPCFEVRLPLANYTADSVQSGFAYMLMTMQTLTVFHGGLPLRKYLSVMRNSNHHHASTLAYCGLASKTSAVIAVTDISILWSYKHNFSLELGIRFFQTFLRKALESTIFNLKKHQIWSQ